MGSTHGKNVLSVVAAVRRSEAGCSVSVGEKTEAAPQLEAFTLGPEFRDSPYRTRISALTSVSDKGAYGSFQWSIA